MSAEDCVAEVGELAVPAFASFLDQKLNWNLA